MQFSHAPRLTAAPLNWAPRYADVIAAMNTQRAAGVGSRRCEQRQAAAGLRSAR